VAHSNVELAVCAGNGCGKEHAWNTSMIEIMKGGSMAMILAHQMLNVQAGGHARGRGARCKHGSHGASMAAMVQAWCKHGASMAAMVARQPICQCPCTVAELRSASRRGPHSTLQCEVTFMLRMRRCMAAYIDTWAGAHWMHPASRQERN